MSKKKIKNPPVKAVPNEENDCCESDICNECREKMIEEGICPDCGGPIDECSGGSDEDERVFDDCIMFNVAKDFDVPIVAVTCEGRTYIGGLATWNDDGLVWLTYPLVYSEFIDNKALLGGFNKPIMQAGIPERMGIRVGSMRFLNKELNPDMNFAKSYIDSLQRGKAADSGIVLPNVNPVSGLQ
jgi:hypothetical protein